METLAPRRRFDESKVKRNKGRFARKAVGALFRPPPALVRGTPEANVFRRHNDGDVTHVSDDGSQRMVYDEVTDQFDQQVRQPDGSWQSIGKRGKLQAYLLTKLGWRAGEQEDQDAPALAVDAVDVDSPDVSAPDASASATHSSIATPADDISALTPEQIRNAYNAVNAAGSVLSDPYTPPEDLAQVASNVADEQSLTPLQVLRAVDAHEASLYGDPNTNRIENRVVQHLAGADFPAPGGPLTTDGPAPAPLPATVVALPHQDTAPFPISDDFPTRTDTDMARIQREMEAQSGARTPAEIAAIRDYSVTAYQGMNECLRTGSGCDPNVIDRNNELESAMRPITEPVTVFRRMMLDNLPGVTSAADLQSLVGSDITDAGFTSTSLDPAQTQLFGNVRLQIAVPTGTRATVPGAHSVHSGEQEVILAPGTRYRVIDVDTSGTTPAVQLEVVL